jgi:hypothetical protein
MSGYLRIAWLCALLAVAPLGCSSGGVPEGYKRVTCTDPACPKCRGTGSYTCRTCGGTGRVRCPVCGARGATFSARDRLKPKVRGCSCGGTGQVQCGRCGGRGKVRCIMVVKDER